LPNGAVFLKSADETTPWKELRQLANLQPLGFGARPGRLFVLRLEDRTHVLPTGVQPELH
jgi:hypothetical protein